MTLSLVPASMATLTSFWFCYLIAVCSSLVANKFSQRNLIVQKIILFAEILKRKYVFFWIYLLFLAHWNLKIQSLLLPSNLMKNWKIFTGISQSIGVRLERWRNASFWMGYMSALNKSKHFSGFSPISPFKLYPYLGGGGGWVRKNVYSAIKNIISLLEHILGKWKHRFGA